MAVLLSVIVTFVIIGFLWFYVARPILEAYGVIGPRAVSYYQVDTPARVRVMSQQVYEIGAVPQPVPPVPVPGTPQNEPKTTLNLTEREIIELLARAQDERGRYRYTGKKIYTLVGGNHGHFLATMRSIRGDAKDDLPEAPPHVTPIVGRATSARFETDPDYPYQAPA